MAHPFDAKSTFKLSVAGTTSTWSHVVGSGSNRVLVVLVNRTFGSAVVTGITYAGNALTEVLTGVGGNLRITAWLLMDPPTGTADIVATHGTSSRHRFNAASFSADGALTLDTPVAGEIVTATEATAILTVTPTGSPALGIGAFTTGGSSSSNPVTGTGGGQTLLYNDVDVISAGSAWAALATSYILDMAATPTDFTHTKALGTDDSIQAVLVFVEAASGTDHAASGTSAGVGSASGAAAIGKAGAGTSPGAGAATGTVTVNRAVSGLSAGIGNQSAAVTVDRAATGTSGGIGGQSGFVIADVAASGTSGGIGAATGAVSVDRAASGTSSGVGDASGAAAQQMHVSGLSGGIGGAEGDATVDGPGPVDHEASGTSSGAGGATGRAQITHGASGASSGIGGASGVTVIVHGASGLSGGVGGASGVVTVTRFAAGTIGGVGGVTGHVVIDHGVGGVSPGIGGASGDATVTTPSPFPPPVMTFAAGAPTLTTFAAGAPSLAAFSAGAPSVTFLAGDDQ